MQKLFLSLLFYGSLFFSSLIMIFSMGWLLFIGGIIILPIMIIHIIGGARALRRIPSLNRWIYISSFLLLVIALLRPDMDDVNSYTGYSAMLFNLGFRPNQYTEIQWYTLGLDILLFVLLIFVDISMMRLGKNPPPLPKY